MIQCGVTSQLPRFVHYKYMSYGNHLCFAHFELNRKVIKKQKQYKVQQTKVPPSSDMDLESHIFNKNDNFISNSI